MKRNIALMYAIALFQGMVFYAPVATRYRQAQGVSLFQITIIESVSLALCIVLELPWGMLSDRIGYRKTMILCYGLDLVSKIIFWRATSFLGFLLERILLSIVMTGLSGVDSSMLYLSCRGKDSQRVFGIYNAMGMCGLLLAAGVFSGWIQERYSFAAFLTILSYGAAAGLSLFLKEVKSLDPTRTKPEFFRKTVQSTLGNRQILLFLIAAACLSEAHQTITVFLSQVQFTRCGMPDRTIGILYILTTVLGLCSVWSSALTKRIGIRRTLSLLCGGAVFACITESFAKSAVPSVSGILMLRAANSLFRPLQTELQNRQIQSENRATALSIHAMVMDSIGILTNLCFGAIAAWNLSYAFGFGGLICLFGWILFQKWRSSMPNSFCGEVREARRRGHFSEH